MAQIRTVCGVRTSVHSHALIFSSQLLAHLAGTYRQLTSTTGGLPSAKTRLAGCATGARLFRVRQRLACMSWIVCRWIQLMGRLQLSCLGEWLSNCGGPEVSGPTGSRPTGSQMCCGGDHTAKTSVPWLGLCRFDSCRRHTQLVMADGCERQDGKRRTWKGRTKLCGHQVGAVEEK